MEAQESVSIEVMLSVHGVPLKLTLAVPSKPVKPQAMLPVFQRLSDTYTDFAARLIAKAGQQISCKKGCAACCRQLIPLAEIEVYHISALVDKLPEPRRSEIRARFASAIAKLRESGWLEQLEQCEDEASIREAALSYYLQRVDCPFLESEMCSIHEVRPIGCREYLVTSPKEHCDNLADQSLRMLPLLVNAADGVRRVGRSGRLGSKSIVPLVQALHTAEQYPDNFLEKTGQEWLSEFFGSHICRTTP